MRVSDRGLAFIAGHEGVVTRAYRDVAGVWTIGVGHTAAAGAPTPRAGMTISRGEALAILSRDLPRYERRVAAALGNVRQHVFDGATSFDFNTGAVHRASWVAAFRAGDMAAARLGLMKWVKAGGRTVKGLVRRREAEGRLIFAGDYGDHGGVTGLPDATADVRAWQSQLATIGFDPGPLDGIAGPRTRAAVLAYQRAHDDLVVDGIVGPATRASLARDIAARERMRQVGGGAIASVILGGTAGAAAEGDPLAWAMLAAMAVLVLAGGIFAWRYRGELRRFFRTIKGA